MGKLNPQDRGKATVALSKLHEGGRLATMTGPEIETEVQKAVPGSTWRQLYQIIRTMGYTYKDGRAQAVESSEDFAALLERVARLEAAHELDSGKIEALKKRVDALDTKIWGTHAEN